MRNIYIVLVILVMALSLGATPLLYAGEGSYTEGSHKGDDMAGPAIKGYCPVCVVNGQLVKGKDDYTAEYDGTLYKFPGQKQKDMFLADPEKYTENLDNKFWNLKKKAKSKYQKKEGSGSENRIREGSGSN